LFSKSNLLWLVQITRWQWWWWVRRFELWFNPSYHVFISHFSLFTPFALILDFAKIFCVGFCLLFGRIHFLAFCEKSQWFGRRAKSHILDFIASRYQSKPHHEMNFKSLISFLKRIILFWKVGRHVHHFQSKRRRRKSISKHLDKALLNFSIQ